MASQQMVSVQVKDGQLRSSPSFLGRIIARVNYADRLQAVDTRSGWTKVRVPGTSAYGWIHSSAVTTKKIVLKAGAEDVQKAATSEELALAGKGFNEQVEGEFKKQHKDVDFTWVDRMEKFTVSQTIMRRFLEEGGLSPEGGPQ